MANTAYDCFLATAAEAEAAGETPPLTAKERAVLYFVADFGERLARRDMRTISRPLRIVVSLLESEYGKA